MIESQFDTALRINTEIVDAVKQFPLGVLYSDRAEWGKLRIYVFLIFGITPSRELLYSF